MGVLARSSVRTWQCSAFALAAGTEVRTEGRVMIDKEEGNKTPNPPHALPGEKISLVVPQVTGPAQLVQPPVKVNVSEKLPLAEGFQPDVFRADAFQAAP